MEKRIELVKQWVEYLPPDKKIIDQLKDFGWDYSGEPFIMGNAHIYRILDRYLKGELTEDDVHQWADFLEGREDVDYKEFNDIIFYLANPEVNGELSFELANTFIQELKAQH